MSTLNRLLFAGASLLLLLAFLFPLWTISLSAPQYPEGIGLRIWAHQITGQQPQDLHNINGLNHYIGMKRIEPDSIPELRILPAALVAFAALGLAGALLGWRWFLGLWLVLLLAGSLAGLVDFYLWEYDYGHNLDPAAAIKVPGMSYQPPLIGTKQLLNMRTTALPGIGGLAVAASLLLGVVAWRRSRQDAPPRPVRRPAPVVPAFAAAILLLLGASACQGTGEREIRYRSDGCARCRMIIMDPRYGAELVTRHGKALVFDSVECLAAHLQEKPADAVEARAVLVTHFNRPKVLAPAATSVFLHSAQLPSPMGLSLTACATKDEAMALMVMHEGRLLDWSQLQAFVKQSWQIP